MEIHTHFSIMHIFHKLLTDSSQKITYPNCLDSKPQAHRALLQTFSMRNSLLPALWVLSHVDQLLERMWGGGCRRTH